MENIKSFSPWEEPKSQSFKAVRRRNLLIGASFLLLCSIPSLLGRNSLSFIPKHQSSPASEIHGWKDIKPSKSLQFEKCYDGLECARLDVPLDWTSKNRKGGRRAAIAIARLPAQVSVTDPRYGGAILVNPGGPGGSGVELVAMAGISVQQIVDTPGDDDAVGQSREGRHFDIIGFDPRGVANTTPSTRCFPDDAALGAWALQARGQGFPRSNESFANSWSRQVGLAQSCSWRMGQDDDEVMEIGRYVGTPSVAEDMLAIAEALGEWRENEAKRLTQKDSKTVPNHVIECLKWRKGKEKLLYWGFSYGTLLGSTFATLHPDRIERMALDGVVDAEDYYSTKWLANLQDADSIIDSFLKQCHEAGAGKCQLYEPSLGALRRKYFEMLQNFKDNPVSVAAYDQFGPEIITYEDVLGLTVSALYAPVIFPLLAGLINDLANGNGKVFVQIKQNIIPAACRSPVCERHPWSKACHSPDFPEVARTVTSAILCGDGIDIRDWSRDQQYLKWRTLESQSTTMGARWSEITMPCSSWDLRPVWQFNKRISAANTSHPILFLSNTRDPVTPLRNAEKMAKRFPGSVVFGQDADGHCTLAQPSRCVAKGIQEYFNTGALPGGGTACKPDRGMFQWDVEEYGLSQGEMELSRAMRTFANASRRRVFPLGI